MVSWWLPAAKIISWMRLYLIVYDAQIEEPLKFFEGSPFVNDLLSGASQRAAPESHPRPGPWPGQGHGGGAFGWTFDRRSGMGALWQRRRRAEKPGSGKAAAVVARVI